MGVDEELAGTLLIAKKDRSEAQQQRIIQVLTQTDGEYKKAQDALAKAKSAVPPDAQLVAFQNRQKALEKETPDDPQLVQLREDAKQSTDQLKNLRLTAAEDLTWALINSPAFLFNH